VRLDDLNGVSAAHPLLTVDGHREVELVVGQLAEAALEAVPLGRAGRVAALSFVVGFRNGDDGVHATHPLTTTTLRTLDPAPQ
jgi:hypothetical protein